MGKKNSWNADEMQGSLISDMENEVKNGYQQIGQGMATAPAAPASTNQQAPPRPSSLQSVGEITDAPTHGLSQAPATAGATAAEKPAMSARQDEPTKGVQANLPLSLYNRMKRLKFETDESFQSMFQRAMDLFLDVEEGKITVAKQ